jgi:nucleoid-associated protein YgaU
VFFVFFRKRKPQKNTTKQWFPKNMAESAEPHENPPDDTGRTEPSSQTQVILRHGGDVLQQEFQAVDVGRLTPPRLLLGASTSVGDGGHLTPQRQKKRAVGKKLTPKKKSV